VQHVVGASPRLHQIDRSRWTLATVRTAIVWLALLSDSGVYRVLNRLGIRYRRGQAYLHSPDPLYYQKLAAIADAWTRVLEEPGKRVLLYQDEFTYCRRPSVSRAYGPAGAGPGPRAAQGLGRNRQRRVLGVLNRWSGRLFCWQRSRANVATQVRFFRAVEEAYPHAEEIWVALDNWPVHFHEDLLAALARGKIRLLRLPTYAPWTNPIEKVWRWLHQDVLHQHDFADDWEGLQRAVQRWLGKWLGDSPQLLRYVGLAPD
jgi:transposase